MLNKLSKISGIYIDENDNNIIKTELNELIDELKVLDEIEPSDSSNKLFNGFSDLRTDVPKSSLNTEDVLLNSKSQNGIGFTVNKII